MGPFITKKQLYEKIKFKKLLSVFKTDKIANLHGHEVLRTPVRHCEVNPIEVPSICNHVGLDSAFLVAGLVVIKINYYWGNLTPINAILFPN
jgi:hypothetical protein